MRATESLWLETAAHTPRSALAENLTVDVAVIGGGITGLTTALLLKRGGARVAVLERMTIGGGATGFTTAKASALQSTILQKVRSARGAEVAAAYAAASMAALERIAGFVADEGIECALERLPAYTYAADENEIESIEDEYDAAREAGLPVDRVTEVPLPFGTAGAVKLDGQLQFQPVDYVRGLAAGVEGGGSRVFEHTAVMSVDDGSPCRVETEGGATVTADQVVVATNYPLLDRGGFFARLEPQRSYLVAGRVEKGDTPAAMLISAGESAPMRSFRPYTCDGETWLLVGGEGHAVGAADAQPERYERLAETARVHFGIADGDLPYRWSTQDTMPPDHTPFIGRYHPATSRLFVGTGFQKWGMTNGTLAGMVIADLIGGRDNEWAGFFTPNRLSASQVPEIAKLGAKTTAGLVGDRLKPAEVGSSDDVPAGEARVVRAGLGKTGVFRDDAGSLHAVSLRCTHLGCLVHWNDAERSWDCPCHGSRFGVDGEVLAGPAVSPLEKRDPPK